MNVVPLNGHGSADVSLRRTLPRNSSRTDRAQALEARRWMIGVGLALALAVSSSALLAADAAATTDLTVGPGKEVPVDTSDKPMVNKSAGLKGTVTLDQQGPPPSIHRLLYKAPADAKVEITETIRYEKDGKVIEKGVRVTKPADAAAPSASAPTEGPYAAAFKIVLQLFLVAVLLEQALSVIFNWRPFLQNFDARGVKTVVSVVVAWFVVNAFRLDFVKDLVNAYAQGQDKIASDLSSQLLTAMILAGGSSGVNNLLIALGFRSMRSAEAIVPKPPHKEAWIAVRLIRDKAVGSVTASIGIEGEKPSVAGIISGTSGKNRLLRYFLVDRGRFPTVGGYAIQREDGKAYFLQLDGFDAQRQPLAPVRWGPFPIAPAAIIDIELRL